jgi:hypothetical protein
MCLFSFVSSFHHFASSLVSLLWQKFYIQIIHGNMLLECCSLPDVRDEEWRGVRRGPNMLFLIKNNVFE